MAVEVVASAWIARHRGETKVVDDPDAAAAEPATDEAAEKTSSGGKKAGGAKKKGGKKKAEEEPEEEAAARTKTIKIGTVEYFKAHYKTELQDHLVTIEIRAPQAQKPSAPGGIDLQSVGALLGFLRDSDTMRPTISVVKKVSEAIPIATQDALEKLIDENAVNQLARTLAEEEGVVFIDEIDKVVSEPNSANADVSSTGVQQDLLPLVEGSNVTMKDGSVIATDNILFICSGAFHVAKTSDMIAELQGRLPVRVELKPLTESDFRRILTEPKYNLLLQHRELMKTEQITLDFTDDGVKALARVTCAVNAQGQNIGARRLHTILERVVDDYSFNCEDYEGKTVTIDEAKVTAATEKLEKNVNLAKYLL
ncbi:ATP-dependent HslUV protease ATP-binding protein subunit HslU [Strigomonas culicis]|uniref:ATP-dependent HslUV protease ATP-binding protein subunit HslU n=1 Tax=Strigomonas culicis TaxID=28005 RepID=S9VUR1_9TRYP|nr:ATP-dependent HslUV protease ATP-binding protein subunit HslU [Strigomonas culicis]|eukprot:EPY30911.1 ATP-dependent HslUV protease ATP-binding protein subunit HslU [Strigomonas culicis]